MGGVVGRDQSPVVELLNTGVSLSCSAAVHGGRMERYDVVV